MGKTERVLQWMRTNPDGVLLCHTKNEVERLRNENPDIFPSRFVYMGLVGDKLRGYPVSNLAIDNLDLMLPFLLGVPQIKIDLVTATGENDG